MFGKRQTAVVPAPQAAARGTMDALREQETTVERRIGMLEKQRDSYTEKATEANKKGNKESALLWLKKRAAIDEEIKTANASLLKLSQQRMALENAVLTNATLNTMQTAVGTMKAMQAEWSADKVADLHDELHEVSDTAAEIRNIMREQVGPAGPTDDELMANFLAEQMTVSTATVVTTPQLPIFPALPVSPPSERADIVVVEKEGKKIHTMEEELSAL